MKKYLLLLLFSLSFQLLVAQDYSIVDAKVKQYPKQFRSVDYLAKRISKDFITDIDKTRALCFWLANNISYDYNDANDGDSNYKSIRSDSDEEYKTKLTRLQLKYANRCLNKRMAICEGYSQIMKHTLDILNVECTVISGYAKRKAREIGRIINTTNHAWNAVKIDGHWQLIDVTWSTGNTATDTSYDFNDTYFLINPKKLILSHLPKNQKWQLLKNAVSKSKFFYFPVIYSTFYTSGIELDTNTKGLIKVKTGKNITLVLKKINAENKYYYKFKDDRFSPEIKFKKVKNNYIAEIPFTSKRNSELTIYCNTKGVLKFKVLVAK